MPRTQQRFVAKDNEVVRRLKAGKGSVACIEMLCAVDDLALMPVKVLGIDFGSDGQHGVLIRVEPIGGHGHLWIAPTNLIDNTPASIDLFKRKCSAQDAIDRIAKAKNDRERRVHVLNLRTAMNGAQRKMFDEKLPDRVGLRAVSDPVAAINKASGDWEFRDIGALAAKILFDVFEVDEYAD